MKNELSQKQVLAPTAKSRAQGCLILAACMFGMSIWAFFNPQVPPYTSRLAWFEMWAYQTFGPLGTACVYAVLGLIIVLFGAYLYRAARSSAKKSVV